MNRYLALYPIGVDQLIARTRPCDKLKTGHTRIWCIELQLPADIGFRRQLFTF